MNIFSKVSDILTGGVGSKVLDIIDKQFPGKLSATEKAELDKSLMQMDIEREREGNQAINEASTILNKRIEQYEGTAADVKGIFFIGPLIILVRSLFRPVCSYVTLYIDYKYFLGPGVEWPEGTTTLLIIINLIVLGFWFGERTIKNLMPLFMAWMDKRSS